MRRIQRGKSVGWRGVGVGKIQAWIFRSVVVMRRGRKRKATQRRAGVGLLGLEFMGLWYLLFTANYQLSNGWFVDGSQGHS